jgi:membrane protein implicated in regulation of membrane protease activity
MEGVPVPVLWIAVGIVLVLLEMATPGVYMVWLGLAAIATGLVMQVAALGLAGQVIVFAVFAAGFITLGLRLRGRRAATSLNTPASGLVGREAVALDFHGRHGRVRVGDSDWNARLADDVPVPQPREALRVVAVEGTVLVVGPG